MGNLKTKEGVGLTLSAHAIDCDYLVVDNSVQKLQHGGLSFQPKQLVSGLLYTYSGYNHSKFYAFVSCKRKREFLLFGICTINNYCCFADVSTQSNRQVKAV